MELFRTQPMTLNAALNSFYNTEGFVLYKHIEEIIRMVCELLLSSVWLLFVVFWVETISVWLFLCLFYQDRAFYHWGDGVFADDPGQMLYMLSRSDRSIHTQT
ncbi:hypothetical protein HF521_002667 [Silurus meridionalis]|uniref:Uncharacterized protein n=2 Tax=Siluroidei TaxID=1489793 RepID=A0A8T0B3B3_SILME|nr:hypothetical protein HF521_002667 [Silurus meridionalis]